MPKLKRAAIKMAPMGKEADQSLAEDMVDMLVAEGFNEYQPVNMIRHVMRSQGMYKGKHEHKKGRGYRADNARLDLFVLLQHPDVDARDVFALFELAVRMCVVPIDASVFDPLRWCDMGEVEPTE